MKNTLPKVGFKFICNASELTQNSQRHDLSPLKEYSKTKGIFAFVENNEIIYVGRTLNLKERIGQYLGTEKDTGSFLHGKTSIPSGYDKLLNSDIYVLKISDDDFKKDILVYSIFHKN